MSVVKTFPMNQAMLGGHSVQSFFATVVPTQQRVGRRLGAFFVIGRNYIAKTTLPGTLVLFQLNGQIVAHARLQHDWRNDVDPSIAKHGAVAIYFFEDSTPLATPLRFDSLPTRWQAQWQRFDAYPRTLDGRFEKEFLGNAR